jgi:hypothetical protein
MKVRQEDNDPCRYIVSSESDGDTEYVVDICMNPIGLDEYGRMKFNGACVETHKPNEWLEVGCPDFRYRCNRGLKNPANAGKTFRCKHCVAAREYAFGSLLPFVAKNRPNIPDHQQV